MDLRVTEYKEESNWQILWPVYVVGEHNVISPRCTLGENILCLLFFSFFGGEYFSCLEIEGFPLLYGFTVCI